MANHISAELRAEVARRAGYRCEYCQIHEDDAGFSHQIDHIISRKHGGASTPDNLAYACVFCNRHKGSDVAPVDSQSGDAVRLYNPRRDHWSDHFRYNSETVEALSACGRATVRLLRLNLRERVNERREISR